MQPSRCYTSGVSLTRGAAVALCALTALSGCEQAPAQERLRVEETQTPHKEYVPAPTKLYLPQHPDIELAWKLIGGKGNPPLVVFVSGAALDCPDGGVRWVYPGLGCVGGLYDHHTDTIKVSNPETWWRLPHEMMHAKKYRETGDTDFWHGGHGGWDILKWERASLDPAEKMLFERGWH